MTTKKYWRINCDTDGLQFVYSLNEPTQCPINPAHTVLAVTLVSKNLPAPKVDVMVGSSINNFVNYTSISEAFGDGNTSVYVKSGTYTENTDIVIPNGGKLIGESTGNVIIELTSGASITIDGSSGVNETSGTIDIVNSSKTISGTGTTFTNLSAGQYILLGNNFYEIESIANDTSLDVVNAYQGISKSNISYIAQAMINRPLLRNLTVKGSSATGIMFRAAQNVILDNVDLMENDTNLEILDCGLCNIQSITSQNATTGPGVSIDQSSCVTFSGCNIFNNNSHGMNITNGSSHVSCLSCNISSNNGSGCNIDGNSKNINLSDSNIKQNKLHGIHAATTASQVVTNSCSIMSNGSRGILLDGTKCMVNSCNLDQNALGIEFTNDDNSIKGTVIDGSSDHGMSISGNNHVIEGNRIRGSGNKGLYIAGNNSSVINNLVSQNTGNGIELTSLATSNLVRSNTAHNNTGIDMVDGGSDTTFSNNILEPIFCTSFRKSSNTQYIETNSKTNRTACVFFYPGTSNVSAHRIEFVAATRSGTTSSSFSLQDIDGKYTYGTATPVVSGTPTRYEMINIGVSPNDTLPDTAGLIEFVYNNGGSGRVRLYSFVMY